MTEIEVKTALVVDITWIKPRRTDARPQPSSPEKKMNLIKGGIFSRALLINVRESLVSFFSSCDILMLVSLVTPTGCGVHFKAI